MTEIMETTADEFVDDATTTEATEEVQENEAAGEEENTLEL